MAPIGVGWYDNGGKIVFVAGSEGRVSPFETLAELKDYVKGRAVVDLHLPNYHPPLSPLPPADKKYVTGNSPGRI